MSVKLIQILAYLGKQKQPSKKPQSGTFKVLHSIWFNLPKIKKIGNWSAFSFIKCAFSIILSWQLDRSTSYSLSYPSAILWLYSNKIHTELTWLNCEMQCSFDAVTNWKAWVGYWQVPILNKTILSMLYRTLNSVRGNNWSEKSLFSNLIVLTGCSSWLPQFMTRSLKTELHALLKKWNWKLSLYVWKGYWTENSEYMGNQA